MQVGTAPTTCPAGATATRLQRTAHRHLFAVRLGQRIGSRLCTHTALGVVGVWMSMTRVCVIFFAALDAQYGALTYTG